jgi:hypothetical protein
LETKLLEPNRNFNFIHNLRIFEIATAEFASCFHFVSRLEIVFLIGQSVTIASTTTYRVVCFSPSRTQQKYHVHSIFFVYIKVLFVAIILTSCFLANQRRTFDFHLPDCDASLQYKIVFEFIFHQRLLRLGFPVLKSYLGFHTDFQTKQ